MQATDGKAKLVVLSALVVFLGMLAVRASFDLAAGPARAGTYDHVHYLGGFVGSSGAAMVLLDTRSGDVWIYGLTEQSVMYMGKLTELGQPLARTTERPRAAPPSQLQPI